MEHIELKVTTREALGKKVRFLRRQGIIPVHLFGHNVESLALQGEEAEVKNVLAQAGRTKLVALKVDKAKNLKTAVVRDVQKEPLTGKLLHVDFYQVNMTEKIKVDVPINLIGEAPIMKSKGNMMLHELSILTIECLPDAIPNSIDVDLSTLTRSEQAIQVKDLVIGKGITVLNDPEHTVVKISAHMASKGDEEKKAVETTAEASTEPAEKTAKE